MDINLLKIFAAVAEQKSFTLGAKKTNMTQANATLRIKQFEKNLGFKVFHRIPTGVVLTKEGKKLLPIAEDTVSKLREIQVKIDNIDIQKSLIIATTLSNATIRIIPFIQNTSQNFPDLEIEIITGDTSAIAQLVLDYKADIAFINHTLISNELMILNKFDNELVLIESKNKSQENTILAYGSNCVLYNGLKKMHKIANITNFKTIVIEDFETILACVEIGMGKSLVPKVIVKKFRYLDKLKTTSVDKNIINVTTSLICRKDNMPKISDFLKNIQM